MQNHYTVSIKLSVLADDLQSAKDLGQAAVEHLFETFNDNQTIQDSQAVDAWLGA